MSLICNIFFQIITQFDESYEKLVPQNTERQLQTKKTLQVGTFSEVYRNLDLLHGHNKIKMKRENESKFDALCEASEQINEICEFVENCKTLFPKMGLPIEEYTDRVVKNRLNQKKFKFFRFILHFTFEIKTFDMISEPKALFKV